MFWSEEPSVERITYHPKPLEIAKKNEKNPLKYRPLAAISPKIRVPDQKQAFPDPVDLPPEPLERRSEKGVGNPLYLACGHGWARQDPKQACFGPLNTTSIL